ncbi:hypothetical protein E2C01_068873 [Portunus trituberculatus]|uniref:Uncharacterized protein n=1 Tax=Portunus trituberculatus TaxID=210409 RepID=A0A5B7HX34_PORTR|nr:hypothetical protein [Portunus trituberculatus]
MSPQPVLTSPSPHHSTAVSCSPPFKPPRLTSPDFLLW